jgi:hypothetical protein
MESEWLHSKERLAVERRAKQQKPALEGSAGAAWARMRQRLSRAEREARTARRLAFALSGVSVVAVAGALMAAAPWSVMMGGRGNVAEASDRTGHAQASLPVSAGPEDGMRSQGIALSVPVLPPEQPDNSLTSDVELFRASGAQERQPEPQAPRESGQSTPSATAERPNTQRPAADGPRSQPNPPFPARDAGRVPGSGGGRVSVGQTGKSGRVPSQEPSLLRGGGSTGSRRVPPQEPSLLRGGGSTQSNRVPPQEPSLLRGGGSTLAGKNSASGSRSPKGIAAATAAQTGSSPRADRRPVSVQRPVVRRTKSGTRRTARSSTRRRSRVASRSWRRSRSRRRPTYWRVVQSPRAGAATCRLVDSRGNWWEARRIQPRSRRGGQRK